MDPKPWWMKHISLEPAYFLYTVACILLQFGNTNLYLQKACRHNATKEPNLSTPCEDKENGVLFVANVNAYASSTKMLFIMLSVIISCSWSDRAGKKRKLFLMSAMIGQLLESAFGYVHSYYWTLDVKFGVLTSALSQIIFGNVLTFKTFGFMYLADVVTPTNRTMRFGIFTAVTTLATLLAKLISGFLLHACGFCQYYSICCGISLLAIIFGHLCIEDTSIPVQKKPSFCSVLNIKGHITESAKIILGKRDKKMVTALLLMAIYCVVQFSHDGQLTVVYLYLKYRFDWNEVMYSLFLFYGCIGTVVGTLFSSVILSKLFKVHDALIGIVAALWDAGIAISYIFAFENWQLYLVSGLDIFFGVSTTVCVSLLTKFYDTSEMGHLFAVKQMFNLSIPFCHPVYNLLFKSTLHTLPTAFYFVSFGLYLVAVILYCIIYVLERSGRKNYTKE